MPSDRIRAPRPYPDEAACARRSHRDEQHRPRERRARLDDLPVAREQRDEAALGPVVDVARRVPEVAAGTRRAPCSARATAARAGPRRAGGRRGRSAPSRRPCAPGRARARAPRSRSRARTRRRANGNGSCARRIRYSRFGARALLPLGLDRRVLEVEADDAGRRPRGRPLVGEDRLAAADVEHRRRVDLLEQLAERALERRHQAPDDRVARSRTCRRCCR